MSKKKQKITQSDLTGEIEMPLVVSYYVFNYLR